MLGLVLDSAIVTSMCHDRFVANFCVSFTFEDPCTGIRSSRLGYTANWTVRGDVVYFQVSANTPGWVGIGFSHNRFMVPMYSRLHVVLMSIDLSFPLLNFSTILLTTFIGQTKEFCHKSGEKGQH